jgi:hypothetical protein
MLQSVPLARMVPVRFKASGAPATVAAGWRYYSGAPESPTVSPRTSSNASIACGRAPPADGLADVEIVFEVSELVAEPPGCTTPASWFCPPEA